MDVADPRTMSHRASGLAAITTRPLRALDDAQITQIATRALGCAEAAAMWSAMCWLENITWAWGLEETYKVTCVRML